MRKFCTFSLLPFCFGLSFASSLPPFAQNLVNSLRQLGCDVDLKFQTEGVKVKILCELEEVATWLDSWFRPFLIATIVVAIFSGTLVVLCFVRFFKLNFGICCNSTKCCKGKYRKVSEELDANTIIQFETKGNKHFENKA